jgi:hypothetical protein
MRRAFDKEIIVLPSSTYLQSTPDFRIKVALNAHLTNEKPIKIIQLDSMSGDLCAEIYSRSPSLSSSTFSEQMYVLMNRSPHFGFQLIDPLKDIGFTGHYIIGNAQEAQLQWAYENNLHLRYPEYWKIEILLAQFKNLQPDVLIVTDPYEFDTRVLRMISPRPCLIVGWITEELPLESDWSIFDLMIGIMPEHKKFCAQKGALKTAVVLPGSRLPSVVLSLPKNKIDLAIVCEAATLDEQTIYLVNRIAHHHQNAPIPYSLVFHFKDSVTVPENAKTLSKPFPSTPEELHNCSINYQAIVHLESNHDHSYLASQNLFLWASHGILIFTPYKSNLADLFLPGYEIEGFDKVDELLNKFNAYLLNPEQRSKLSALVKQRVVHGHSVESRAREIIELIGIAIPASVAGKIDCLKEETLFIDASTDADQIDNSNEIVTATHETHISEMLETVKDSSETNQEVLPSGTLYELLFSTLERGHPAPNFYSYSISDLPIMTALSVGRLLNLIQLKENKQATALLESLQEDLSTHYVNPNPEVSREPDTAALKHTPLQLHVRAAKKRKYLKVALIRPTTTSFDSLYIKAQILLEGGAHIESLACIDQILSSGRTYQGLHMLRAQCLYAFGGDSYVWQARNAVLEELCRFPENIQAQGLLNNYEAEYAINRLNSIAVDSQFDLWYPDIANHTMLQKSALFALYRRTKLILEREVPGVFVDIGCGGGGVSQLLALMIERFSKKPRTVVAIDSFAGMPTPEKTDTIGGRPTGEVGWGKGTCTFEYEEVKKYLSSKRYPSGKLLPIDVLKRTIKNPGDLALLLAEHHEIALAHVDIGTFGGTFSTLVDVIQLLHRDGSIAIEHGLEAEGVGSAINEFLWNPDNSVRYVGEECEVVWVSRKVGYAWTDARIGASPEYL